MMVKLCSLTRDIFMAYHKLAYKLSGCGDHINESEVNSLNGNKARILNVCRFNNIT